jgi:uncharacterized membrane protein YkvA (DUF1232 family)
MRFGRTSTGSKSWTGSKAWSGKARRAAPNLAEDERVVRAGFWVKVKRQAAKLPFAEDLLAAYYCAFDRETPLQVRAVLLGALAYFVLPFDAIPDMLPVLGFTDDAAVLAAAMKLVIDNIRPEHREAARRKLEDI